jgi:hypothetical protein
MASLVFASARLRLVAGASLAGFVPSSRRDPQRSSSPPLGSASSLALPSAVLFTKRDGFGSSSSPPDQKGVSCYDHH